MLHFDPTITLGTILHAVILIATVLGAAYRLGVRLTRLETQMSMHLEEHRRAPGGEW